MTTTGRCDVDWGSATESQRCVLRAGHGSVHYDGHGHEWTTDGPRAGGAEGSCAKTGAQASVSQAQPRMEQTAVGGGTDSPGPACRTCGFTHPETDCPRWSAPLFDQLTIDELKSLMAAVITRHGYSSNKMTRVLGTTGGPVLRTYVEIANEVGDLYQEIAQTLIARFGVAA